MVQGQEHPLHEEGERGGGAPGEGLLEHEHQQEPVRVADDADEPGGRGGVVQFVRLGQKWYHHLARVYLYYHFNYGRLPQGQAPPHLQHLRLRRQRRPLQVRVHHRRQEVLRHPQRRQHGREDLRRGGPQQGRPDLLRRVLRVG
uniref:Uncharacterized protein n=1 Tax=Arcella intermedia TaxID=1963864 RepID=A0A6B2LLB9_9EUKA